MDLFLGLVGIGAMIFLILAGLALVYKYINKEQ